MEIEGIIYWEGTVYDDDGHCDEYDLMFVTDDNKITMCLNGCEHIIFPKYYNERNEGTSPMSVHDKIHGKLSLAFEQDKPMMICNKAEECGIDCEDKKPHSQDLACSAECDWHGKCIPIKEQK